MFDYEVGMCAVCGTVHTNDAGFSEDRTCRNCGEERVYSIVEYRDIVMDWVAIKEEYEIMMDIHGLD